MNLLCLLVAKDLRRALRNPLPWVIHLAIPLAITALLGLIFGGGGSEGRGLGRVRFALVDEDDSALSRFLRGALLQGQAAGHWEPVVLDRTSALARLEANQLSAVLILPPHFTRDYLTGRTPVRLELIKNPAQSLQPAVLEELLGVVVTGLNAVAGNLRSEFPAWRQALESGADYRRVADLIVRTGEKLDTLRPYLDPPRVWYTREVRSAGEERSGVSGTVSGVNLFGYLLVGLSTMFLLFQANTARSDLHRELACGTFERYHTLHDRLWPFLVAKGVFVGAMVLLSAVILLGGGGLVFGVAWQRPWVMALLVVGYAVFAAGFSALFAAFVPDARAADALDNLVVMALGLAGGCAFPPQSLPVWVRDHITPMLPTAWLAQTLREMEFGSGSPAWDLVLLRLVGLGLALLGVAAWRFRRRFAEGGVS